MLVHQQDVARSVGCKSLTLDSGVQREQAHKFYFREGMTVVGYHVAMPLVRCN